MKRSKFTEAQIAFVLKQAGEGVPVTQACRETWFSEATFYPWRKKYAGLLPSEMKRLAAARGGEREVEADRGRPVTGQGDVADVLSRKL